MNILLAHLRAISTQYSHNEIISGTRTTLVVVGWLEFNIPFQHKYGYIREERSGVENYPYPVKED